MSKGSSTTTSRQELPPAVEAGLTAAYESGFNPFLETFNALDAFNPTAPLQGVSGLTGTEQAAIDAGAGLLSNRPAFLDSAATGLNDMISGGGTNNLLQTQIDDATSRAVDSVSSQYARGGRLGSDSFADSLGRGITNAAAPILAQNLQRDQANRLAAISAAPGLLSADQSIINQALALGGLERGLLQSQQDALFNQAGQQTLLDQNRINALLQATGMGSSLFGQTQSKQNNPSTLDNLSSAAQTAAAVASLFPASDIRLKTKVKYFDTHNNGLHQYTWEWNDKAKSLGFDVHPTIGFIAQDAKEIYPQHVYEHPMGYLTIDYKSIEKERLGASK